MQQSNCPCYAYHIVRKLVTGKGSLLISLFRCDEMKINILPQLANNATGRTGVQKAIIRLKGHNYTGDDNRMTREMDWRQQTT